MTGTERLALLALALLWGSGQKRRTPPAPSGPAGGHVWARDVLERAFAIEKFRAPSKAEAQFLGAWSWVETRYGRSPLLGPAGRDSHNWGAVMCHSATETACFVMQDRFSDGRTFMGRFRVYPDDDAGAADMIKEATTTPRARSGAGLARPDATVFRIALAERREGYYGGICPREAAAAAAAGRALDKSACEREAVTGRALEVWAAMKSIAAELGEPVAMALGSFDDALSWWHAQPQQVPPAGTPAATPSVGPNLGFAQVGPAVTAPTPEMVAWANAIRATNPQLGDVYGPRSFVAAGELVTVLARAEIHGPSVSIPQPHLGVGIHHLPTKGTTP